MPKRSPAPGESGQEGGGITALSLMVERHRRRVLNRALAVSAGVRARLGLNGVGASASTRQVAVKAAQAISQGLVIVSASAPPWMRGKKGAQKEIRRSGAFHAISIALKGGAERYQTIRERRDFYRWFQRETDKRGFETIWA